MKNTKNIIVLTFASICLIFSVLANKPRAAAQEPEKIQKEDESHSNEMDIKKSVESEGVTMKISFHSKMYSGVENFVVLDIENNSDNTVKFIPQAHLPSIRLQVYRNEEAVNMTRYGQACFGESGYPKVSRPIKINPKELVHTKLNLTRYFDLSVPGDYQLVAMWEGSSDEGRIKLETSKIDFVVQVKKGETTSPEPKPRQ